MTSSPSPHSETPLLGPRCLPRPATHLDAAPRAPALSPVPNTHIHPRSWAPPPDLRRRAIPHPGQIECRAHAHPLLGQHRQTSGPAENQQRRNSRLTETQMARRQSNATPPAAEGQGKAAGNPPHPLANLRRRTVPRAGPGGDGDKGLACPLGKGMRDSGLADRRHSHLTFRFWADI